MSDAEFRKRLEAFAAKDGVDAIEAKVRAAIAKGNYGEASRLRAESLDLMRRAASDIKRALSPSIAVSSQPGRIQASLNRRGHTASLQSS